jgi:hypothetical protein
LLPFFFPLPYSIPPNFAMLSWGGSNVFLFTHATGTPRQRDTPPRNYAGAGHHPKSCPYTNCYLQTVVHLGGQGTRWCMILMIVCNDQVEQMIRCVLVIMHRNVYTVFWEWNHRANRSVSALIISWAF